MRKLSKRMTSQKDIVSLKTHRGKLPVRFALDIITYKSALKLC